jgi:hypothetical protein
MLNFLLLMCVAIIVFAIALVRKKIIRAQYYIARYEQKKHKKKKAIQVMQQQANISDEMLDAYEQQLFDDAATQLLQRPPYSLEQSDAEYIQNEVLKKMPAKTLCYIRHLDLEEWSIYWCLGKQSLEYYVGSYGVFYAHVDRFGAEHTEVVQVDA